eukprot:1177326-Prorocentrum_minimum.AAC.3
MSSYVDLLKIQNAGERWPPKNYLTCRGEAGEGNLGAIKGHKRTTATRLIHIKLMYKVWFRQNTRRSFQRMEVAIWSQPPLSDVMDHLYAMMEQSPNVLCQTETLRP